MKLTDLSQLMARRVDGGSAFPATSSARSQRARSCLFGGLTPWVRADYSVVMAKRIESELVVDLRGRSIET
ncbi:hypothetical protein, partial [Streptomyces sp. CS159]|uniref:hypothetical protein n=1 Tax=Streptomyces sp. CS159 TaxID=1982762 RepID=UPI001C52D5B2